MQLTEHNLKLNKQVEALQTARDEAAARVTDLSEALDLLSQAVFAETEGDYETLTALLEQLEIHRDLLPENARELLDSLQVN